jgi:hypothetical protein
VITDRNNRKLRFFVGFGMLTNGKDAGIPSDMTASTTSTIGRT